jgi:hypothetical protein
MIVCDHVRYRIEGLSLRTDNPSMPLLGERIAKIREKIMLYVHEKMLLYVRASHASVPELPG